MNIAVGTIPTRHAILLFYCCTRSFQILSNHVIQVSFKIKGGVARIKEVEIVLHDWETELIGYRLTIHSIYISVQTSAYRPARPIARRTSANSSCKMSAAVPRNSEAQRHTQFSFGIYIAL